MTTKQLTGNIVEIIGAVVDVAFQGNIPDVYHALKVENACWKCSNSWVMAWCAPLPWNLPMDYGAK